MITKLIGTWKLSHCIALDPSGIEQPDPFHDATGIITYDDKGMMAAQIMKADHGKSITGNIFEATDQSYRQAFEDYIAYFGTYCADEINQIVTHSVIGSLWPNMLGMYISRHFQFNKDNSLTLSPTHPETLANEQPITRYLTWIKAT